MREILRAGARGYLLKDQIDSDLLAAVRAVARGEGYLSPAVSDAVLNDYRRHVSDPIDLLTSREREVLQMIAEGKTNKEIATVLNLSVYTVDAHRGADHGKAESAQRQRTRAFRRAPGPGGLKRTCARGAIAYNRNSAWENLLHRDIRLPDERPRLRKGRSARCWPRATRRWRRRRTPAWSSTTPAAFATRRSRRSSTGCRHFKREAGKGKVFGVLGCVAQQEGEKIFDRAPHVSLVCRLRQLHQAAGDAGAARSRQPARHRPQPRYRRDFRHARSPAATIRTAPTSPSSKAATSRAPIAWCRSPAVRSAAAPAKACMAEARTAGRHGLHRNSVAGAERQQLSRPLARRLGFRHAAGARRRSARHPPRALHHFASARFRQSPSSTPWTPTRSSAITCTCRCNPAPTDVLAAMDRLYTRDEYMRAHRVDQERAARRFASPPTSSSASPAKPRRISRQTLDLLDEVQYDSLFSFKYSPRPNTAALAMEDQHPRRRKDAPADDRCRRSSAPSRSAAMPS